MQRLLTTSFFAVLTLISTFLVGCGGGGGGGGGSAGSYAGVYQGTFTRSGETIVLVAISSNGTTEAVVSDSTGILVQGTGTTSQDGVVAVSMTGPAGDTTLSGTFTRAPGGDLTLTGGIGGSLQVGKTGSSNASTFAGKFKIQFQGSASGEIKIVISGSGKVYKRVGSEQTFIGTITSGGKIEFGGEGLAGPPAGDTDWNGTVFLTPGSLGGSGTWQDASNSSIQGTWTAVPDVGDGNPIFTSVTLVKTGSNQFPTILAVSPNGHMAGLIGGTPAYWETPDSMPVLLSHAPGMNVSWPTGVNESGTVTGYSYVANNLSQSRAVVWPNGSSSPQELSYPDEFSSGIASDINSAGVIVGLARKSNGQTRACIWQSKSSTPFIPPKGDAVRISNAGVVLCKANNGWLSSIAATEMNTLFPPAGYGTLQIETMGANGIVVGTAELGGDGKRHPVAWNPAQYMPQALAFIEGFQEVTPLGAGDNGTFVGRGKAQGSPNYQALFWKNATEVVLLNDVVSNTTVAFQGAQFVFADGSILAYGRDVDGLVQVAWLKP